MSPKLIEFLRRWLINTVAVMVAWKLVSGIQCQTGLDLVIAALLLGILNAVVRPLLLLLSLPLLIFTLGLFTLVINALLLEFTGWLMRPHFTVDGFGAAFWGALIITVISLVLNAVVGTGRSRVMIRRGGVPPPANRRDDDKGGPVIDV